MMKCAMFDEVVKHARNEDEVIFKYLPWLSLLLWLPW